jgi:hypothetical protein
LNRRRANLFSQRLIIYDSNQAYIAADQMKSAQLGIAKFKNPIGIPPQSPGLASLRAYPGIEASDLLNPERVASHDRHAKTHEVLVLLDSRSSIFGLSNLPK